MADAVISDPPLRLQNLSFVKRVINARVSLKPSNLPLLGA
ncbi:hypothetical protein CAMRE0001_1721 [Campylobacter rectus RM3267]|uniref:Uncharacterized protein n=1 Tax=Campylobacter rectus RM3267 TaxID=553218 RepID=B9CZD0_CAMRE|nr:hypothetical protein CAMRE0001_1721 [Campylobacter rectus RM3267]